MNVREFYEECERIEIEYHEKLDKVYQQYLNDSALYKVGEELYYNTPQTPGKWGKIVNVRTTSMGEIRYRISDGKDIDLVNQEDINPNWY